MAPKIPDDVKLVGKTAIITGCNTGIGKETVLDFYKRGARVIMACRSVEKATEAKTDIEEKCKTMANTGTLVVEKCDLTSLKSVREFAQKMLDTEQEINILVNNAGVMMCPKGLTEDGFEIQFGTNHLAHFLLTLLLLPRIRNSTSSLARIVTVSSLAHENADIYFDDMNYKKRNYKSYEAYGQSKLANVLFSKELAKKLKEHNIEGIHTYSLHPGVINTDLGRHLKLPWGVKPVLLTIIKPFSKTIHDGALTTIYCAVAPKCAPDTGLYYSDCAIKTPSKKALKDEYAKKLWEASVQLVGLGDYDPFTASDPGVKTVKTPSQPASDPDVNSNTTPSQSTGAKSDTTPSQPASNDTGVNSNATPSQPTSKPVVNTESTTSHSASDTGVNSNTTSSQSTGAKSDTTPSQPASNDTGVNSNATPSQPTSDPVVNTESTPSHSASDTGVNSNTTPSQLANDAVVNTEPTPSHSANDTGINSTPAQPASDPVVKTEPTPSHSVSDAGINNDTVPSQKTLE